MTNIGGQLDVKHVARVTHEEHYGLEKAKERILEYIAVRRPRRQDEAAILCRRPAGHRQDYRWGLIAKALGVSSCMSPRQCA